MMKADPAPSRPVVQWHGGKWLLAPWIIEHFPTHRRYVEPFGGGASVLLRKSRSHMEVWNDLDAEIHNLFQVLRSDDAAELRELLHKTPFSRREFVLAYDRTQDPVERARRLIIRSFMGFGTPGANFRSTGFRSNSNRSGTTPAMDWMNYPDALDIIIERLRGVVIENRDATLTMKAHDSVETLHYVDPPYVHRTRGNGNPYCTKHKYSHELTDDDHLELLNFLQQLDGMVLLSGYPNQLYDDTLDGWHKREREAFADGARRRTEVLWINSLAWERLAAEHMPLFGVARCG